MCSNPSDESQLSISVEQGLPLRQDWLRFSRLRLRGDQPFEMGPLQLHVKAKAGFILHDLPPYEAFSIGGTNSVRGYSGMWAGGERRGRGRGAGEQGEEGEGGGHGLCWRGGKGYQQGCKGGGLLPRGLSGGWPRLGSWGQALSSAAPLAPTIIAMLAATQQHSNTATAMLAATQVTAALLQPSSPPSPGYCYCHPQVLLLPRRNNNNNVYHKQATATAYLFGHPPHRLLLLLLLLPICLTSASCVCGMQCGCRGVCGLLTVCVVVCCVWAQRGVLARGVTAWRRLLSCAGPWSAPCTGHCSLTTARTWTAGRP